MMKHCNVCCMFNGRSLNKSKCHACFLPWFFCNYFHLSFMKGFPVPVGGKNPHNLMVSKLHCGDVFKWDVLRVSFSCGFLLTTLKTRIVEYKPIKP